MKWKQDGQDFVCISPQTGEEVRIPAYGFGAHFPHVECPLVDAREFYRAQKRKKSRIVRRYGGLDVYKGKVIAVSFDLYELN